MTTTVSSATVSTDIDNYYDVIELRTITTVKNYRRDPNGKKKWVRESKTISEEYTQFIPEKPPSLVYAPNLQPTDPTPHWPDYWSPLKVTW